MYRYPGRIVYGGTRLEVRPEFRIIGCSGFCIVCVNQSEPLLVFLYIIYLFPKPRSALPTPRLAHSSDPASHQPFTKDRRPSTRLRARMLQLRPWLWYLQGTLSSIRVIPMTDPYKETDSYKEHGIVGKRNQISVL